MSQPADHIQNAIQVRGLQKLYHQGKGKPKLEALKKVDLDIPRGSFFGLLGPNGAGKSTFINILSGLVNKTAGQASVWGFDIDRNPRNAKISIGVVPQEISFDAFFTPKEALDLQAGLYGVPKNERRTDEILAALSLTDKADAYARNLSGGMKRRLLVAKAMVHQPPILVLDEPTAGVDIELRNQLWEYVRELNERGTTVVLTTHYLEEAEELCDEIAIINHGEVVACEKTPDLLSRIDEKALTFTFAETLTGVPPQLEGLECEVCGPNQLVVRYSARSQDIGEVLSKVQAAGLTIKDLSTREADLEDIFVQLTSKGAAA